MKIGAHADLLRIGEVARDADVNIQTVRYYERRGLLLPHSRSSGGYRLYSADATRIVRFIRRAQAIGFSLDEVTALLELRRANRGSSRDVRSIASAKIADIDARVQDLASMRATLTSLLNDCRCDEHASPEDCVILNALDDSRPSAGRDGSAPRSTPSEVTPAASCGALSRANARHSTSNSRRYQ